MGQQIAPQVVFRAALQTLHRIGKPPALIICIQEQAASASLASWTVSVLGQATCVIHGAPPSVKIDVCWLGKAGNLGMLLHRKYLSGFT